MIGELLERQLAKNKNDNEIKQVNILVKQTVKNMLTNIEKLVYHQFTLDQPEFLEKYALAKVDKESFTIVAQLAQGRLSNIAESIFKGDIVLHQPQIGVEI